MSSKLLTAGDLVAMNNRIIELIQKRLTPGTRITVSRPGKPSEPPLLTTVNGKPYLAETGNVYVPTRNGTVTMQQITNLGLEVDMDFNLAFEPLPPEPIKLAFTVYGISKEAGDKHYPLPRAIVGINVYSGAQSGMASIPLTGPALDWLAEDLIGRKGTLTLELAPRDQEQPVSNPGGES